MTAGDALVVEGLHASYGSREVLHGIDLRVEPGSVSLMLGANGAGKTSTLGALIGRVTSKSGTITFGDRRIDKLDVPSRVQAGIQLVPEGGRVFRDLTVRDNLRLGAYTVPGRFDPKSMEPIFEIFPRVEQRLDQKAGTLSGGERQMVAVGRALMAQPRLMLLDEPFLGLAPVAVESLVAALRRVNSEFSISMLVVESNIKAAEVADRAYVLTLGEITAVDDDPVGLMSGDSQAIREGFLGG